MEKKREKKKKRIETQITDTRKGLGVVGGDGGRRGERMQLINIKSLVRVL